MENRLQVQDIQGEELMDLTPEEEEELKGGGLKSHFVIGIPGFPIGVPVYLIQVSTKEENISTISTKAVNIPTISTKAVNIGQ
ncbi:hypothetical protein [Nostoc sp.]|uniref:hypothetical protein n=1 Tax=Nostoc sp. TaxID=1180 RepID=UPI002FFC3918